MNKIYDYLIIGSGLFGSVCARELTDLGYKCSIIRVYGTVISVKFI